LSPAPSAAGRALEMPPRSAFWHPGEWRDEGLSRPARRSYGQRRDREAA
jgi:hypothetical protein